MELGGQLGSPQQPGPPAWLWVLQLRAQTLPYRRSRHGSGEHIIEQQLPDGTD